ncbi:glycosyltransferase family 4 protein [Serratia sp. UGAL515B_01]|uniref:glycosyltransferase family 4 protein n=1 Tax=Serratia sp. UGAL515B_01 TaxID=2986763 RepID=UPI002953D9AB|nr:glycosyltransferase family 4 protein [Serratia sp. UGAL515B_01]WON76288.1 glycosyltransferase family 4 protein [Serratia sp. UGAL515B_01]
MKLALIIDDYLPKSTRVGAKMFHELALELNSQGHCVTVITPCSEQDKDLVIGKFSDVTVWYFKSGPVKNVSKFQRVVNETLLSFKAWKAIHSYVKHDSFDGVIYYSPSIFWGNLVKRIKNRCQCPSYLVLRDFFPQWVIDAGIVKDGSLIEKYFRFFERITYNQANHIGLMSEKNLELFSTKNQHYSCEVLRNWTSISPVFSQHVDYTSIRERLSLQDKIIFFYGGNIGHAQDMANLMRLARNMQNHENAHFLFVGQGDEVELINSLATQWGLKNYSYLPSVKQEEFKSILAEIDVGLFSLSAQHSTHNFPGKLLGYMAESLPILGSVNSGNDLQDLVNNHGAGFIHINGEDEKLVLSAEKLYFDELLRHSMGDNAKQLMIDKFSVKSAVQLITARLKELTEKPHNA